MIFVKADELKKRDAFGKTNIQQKWSYVVRKRFQTDRAGNH